MFFTPGEYGKARFFFTDPKYGYPPAIEWMRRQRVAASRLKSKVKAVEDRSKFGHDVLESAREDALARLADTARTQGIITSGR